MFQKDMRISVLIDYYGALLSERKRYILELYYNNDFSLAEISENTGISRQGVRDSIKKSVAELTEYDSKLHLTEIYASFNAFKNDTSDKLERIGSSLPSEYSASVFELAEEIRDKNL